MEQLLSLFVIGPFYEFQISVLPWCFLSSSFYHGTIKRSAAERLLLVYKDGSYLVRRSETSKNDYSLTLK